MGTCRLQVIECEFAKLGCDEEFCREEEDRHMEENSRKHLLLSATQSLKSIKELEEMEDRIKKYEDENHSLAAKLIAQEEKAKNHEGEISKLRDKLDNVTNQHSNRLDVQRDKQRECVKIFEEKNDELKKKLKEQEEKCDKLKTIIEGQQKDLDGKILTLGNQLLNQKAAEEKNKTEFENRMDEASKKYDQLEAVMKEQERSLAAQSKSFEKVASLCQELKKSLEEGAKTTSQLEQSIKVLAKEKNKLSEEVKGLSKKAEEGEETLAAYHDRISVLATQKKNPKEIQDLEARIEQNKRRFENLEEKLPAKVNAISEYLGNFDRTFEMKEFTAEKDKDKPRDWKSPAMYTHMCGYKFCIGLDANGRGGSHGEAIYAELYVMPGEYDSLLRWPAKASFTLELIHQRGGKNVKYNTAMKKWEKPELNFKCLSVFPFTEVNNSYCFLEHNKLGDFLVDDTLKFFTTVVLH